MTHKSGADLFKEFHVALLAFLDDPNKADIAALLESYWLWIDSFFGHDVAMMRPIMDRFVANVGKTKGRAAKRAAAERLRAASEPPDLDSAGQLGAILPP